MERDWNPHKTGYEEACASTAALLKQHGVQRPAVPIHEICESFGLRIEESYLGERRSMLHRKERVIYIARFDGVRRRFYIAHELAHFLLPRHYHEHSHSTFASCLLIPHDWIAEDLQHASPEALTLKYQVTFPVMYRRLTMGGLADIDCALPF